MSVYDTLYVNNINSSGNISILPNGELLTNADPITNLGIATKQYVDNSLAVLSFKAPARVATESLLPSYTQSGLKIGATLTGNVNASINDTGIDGVSSLLLNDRILIKSEGTTSDLHNGVYDLTQVGDGSNPWILTRSTDFDEDAEVVSGTYVLITDGSINTDISYVVSTPDPITVESTVIEFVRFAPVTGENNTVSNIGGGVSLYKQKVDIDLEFKTLNSTTAHITIVDDTGNNEVDVVFDQTQITGTNTLVAGSIDTGFGVINTNNSITGADADFTSLTVDNLVLNNNSITATGNVSIIPTGEILLKEKKPSLDNHFKTILD